MHLYAGLLRSALSVYASQWLWLSMLEEVLSKAKGLWLSLEPFRSRTNSSGAEKLFFLVSSCAYSAAHEVNNSAITCLNTLIDTI